MDWVKKLIYPKSLSFSPPGKIFSVVDPFGGYSYWTQEKAMAPYSSTLAWKIPWAEEPGRLHSMGSQRVGHD